MQKLFRYIDKNQMYGLTTEGFQWVHRGEGMAMLKNDPAFILKASPRSYEAIQRFMYEYHVEGIVYKNGEQECEVLRSDFGLPWPDEGAWMMEFEMPMEVKLLMLTYAAEDGMTLSEWLTGQIVRTCEDPERLKALKEAYEKDPLDAPEIEVKFRQLKYVTEEMREVEENERT